MNSPFRVGSGALVQTALTVVTTATPTTLTESNSMKTSHAIFAIALSAATLGGSAFAAPAAEADTNAATQRENWLAIPAIYDKVTAAGYLDISEIERDDDGYEVKGRNADGERVKLLVDPQSGEILDTRTKGEKSGKTDKKSGFWWNSDKR